MTTYPVHTVEAIDPHDYAEGFYPPAGYDVWLSVGDEVGEVARHADTEEEAEALVKSLTQWLAEHGVEDFDLSVVPRPQRIRFPGDGHREF